MDQVNVTAQKTKFGNNDVIQIVKVTPVKNTEELTRDAIVARIATAQAYLDFYNSLLTQIDAVSTDAVVVNIPQPIR